jgi:hypothetical protein
MAEGQGLLSTGGLLSSTSNFFDVTDCFAEEKLVVVHYNCFSELIIS